MASFNKTTSTLALFFCLNILFFSLITAQAVIPTPAPGSPIIGSPTAGAPSPTAGANCPRNFLQIASCTTALNPFILFPLLPPVPCCSMSGGLPDSQAVACLCIAIKQNIVSINNPNRPITPNRLLNACGRNSATNGFQCP